MSLERKFEPVFTAQVKDRMIRDRGMTRTETGQRTDYAVTYLQRMPQQQLPQIRKERRVRAKMPLVDQDIAIGTDMTWIERPCHRRAGLIIHLLKRLPNLITLRSRPARVQLQQSYGLVDVPLVRRR